MGEYQAAARFGLRLFAGRGNSAFCHFGPAFTNGEFRVPGLRNVALTGPYMHAGSLETLDDVAHHYSTLDDDERLHAGGERILRRLDLSPREQADLVAFLETLTEKEPRHEFVKQTESAVCR